jgi:hypothetical protein
MTVLCSEDSLLELPSQCKRASPDCSSYEEEDAHNYKRLKTSTDLLIVFNDDEEDLFNHNHNNNNNNDTHIVPTDTVLLQQHTLPTTTELEYLEGIESSWVTSLLDSDRSPIATLEFSFVDDGFSIEGGFLYVSLVNLPLFSPLSSFFMFDIYARDAFPSSPPLPSLPLSTRNQ